MAKEFIGYGLVSGWSGAGVGFRAIGITSVARRQVYGRFMDDDGITHVSERDLIYRFPEGTSAEQASEAASRYKASYDRLTPAVEAAAKTLKDLQRNREYAALDAAKTLAPHA